MRLTDYILFLLVNRVFAAEFFKNPGFEDPDFSDNWKAAGFNMESITDDVHGGKRAVKVTGRPYEACLFYMNPTAWSWNTQAWKTPKHSSFLCVTSGKNGNSHDLCHEIRRTKSYQGPGQNVNLQPGESYVFKSSIKLLNDHPGKLFQTVKMTIMYTWTADGTTTYHNIALRPYVQSTTGWFSLNGDVTAPLQNFSQTYMYFQSPDPGISFLVDDASLQSVTKDINWKAEANSRIQKIRKNNINVKVTHDSSFRASDIEIKIDHKRHLFGFGSMVRADWINNSDFKGYQKLVYYMFNWATIGGFKWKFDRGTRDHPDYQFAVDAVKEMRKHGIKVRGHNMCWGVKTHSPAWVEALNGTMLKKALETRINYMTGITKGILEHWDVNNELLHGQLYEEKTGDPHYSEKLYKMVHKADPVPKLFLNDYDVVAVGAATEAYVDQAKMFKKADVGLYGLGLQSHFRPSTPPDPTLLKRHLDILSGAGLPLWITEMDLKADDENTRADWYEIALRSYFSHPAVEGLIFWGFWDHQMSEAAALVDGYSYYINAAGKRYLDLVKREWTTHDTHKLSDGSSYTVNAFHGDYDVVVTYKGVPVMYQEFQLGKQDKNLNLHVTGHGSQVSLPTTTDPFAHETHSVHLSHKNEHLIGRASSSAQNKDLQCVTRWSGISPVGDNKAAYAYCQGDEVLTGCSSKHKDGDYHRDGETILVAGGRIACKAINGYQSTGGTQAVARCCKSKNLKCAYRGSGPSDKTIYAQVETTCEQNEIATGCSSSSWNSEMDGAYPSANHKGCIAQNDGTIVGVSSYGACCTAPSLTCTTKVSKPSGQRKGDTQAVACDSGYVMTGCNVRANYGRSAGSHIGGTPDKAWCIATNGEQKFPGEEGAIAVAVCCKLQSHGGSIIG